MFAIALALLLTTAPAVTGSTAGAPSASATTAKGAATPITSRAQLQRYLKDTPLDASPLRYLSPGGRKRFLGQLHFGAKGLLSVPYGDPATELTHEQLVELFSLFDVAQYADDLGLSPAERALREHERAVAAEERGCKVETCPESVIGRDYDQFILHPPDPSLSPARRTRAIEQQYEHLFDHWQNPNALASVNRPDLRLLKRAAEHVVFYAPKPKYIAQLRADLARMHQLGMTTGESYTALYQALVAARRFDAARKLHQHHPGMDVATLPVFHKPSSLPAGQPTALAISTDGTTMTRKAFDLDAPLRIVVVASCHFSQDAARAIGKQPKLRKLFAQHAIWLADPGDSIAAARQWNAEFPDQPIHIAWNTREWSKIDSWAMPTFYIFRHGQLVDQWAGWPNGSTALATLRQHLHKDDIE